MASKSVSFNCGCCNKLHEQTVYYIPEEEINERIRKEDGKYYTKIWGGAFVFGVTVLLFVWFLVLMLKTFEMNKLEKVLGDPNVQYEDTWYNHETDNPAYKSDTIKIVKPSRNGPLVDTLEKQIDQLKLNASKDREATSKLYQDIDLLIKSCKRLEDAIRKEPEK